LVYQSLSFNFDKKIRFPKVRRRKMAIQVNQVHSLTGHTDAVYALQPGALPHLFFSAAGDGRVIQWDLKSPDRARVIAQLPNSIYALRYLPALNLLAVGHNYDGIHLLDCQAGKELRSLKLTTAAIFDLAVFENTLYVATGEGAVVAVNLDSWSIRTTATLSSRSARTLALNPERGELAVGYSDCTIRILDIESLHLRREWVAHDNSVFTVVYSPDFKTLLSGARDARLKAWNAVTDYEKTGEVIAHLFALNHIAFSPDAKHFVTCSLDKSIKVWGADELKLLKVIDKARHAGHGTSVNKLLWTPFEQLLISASDDRTIRVWDIAFTPDAH
jgi:WD40 repeat protein